MVRMLNLIRLVALLAAAAVALSSCSGGGEILLGYYLYKELIDKGGSSRIWHGTVTDTNGQALAGYTVEITANRPDPAGDIRRSTQTDDDGKYEIVMPWYEIATYEIRVSHDNVTVYHEDVGLVFNQDQLRDIQVSPIALVTVSGTVTDCASEPLPQVFVAVAKPASIGTEPDTLVTRQEGGVSYQLTNSTGVYYFEDIFGEPLLVTAFHPQHGFGYYYIEAPSPINSGGTVTMPGAERIEVRVRVLDSTGQPLESAVLPVDYRFTLRLEPAYDLSSQIALAVAEEGLSLAEEQLRNATLRFQAGDAPRFEVIQGEVAVSQAKEELVQAHNGYQLARSALFLAIGVVPQDYFHGKPVAIGYQDTLTRAVENIRDRIFPTLDGEKLAAEYVEKTPDYASLQSSIDSLNYQVKGWRRAPFVTLDASYSHQSGSLMMKRNNYSFGITANLNVFDSLKTESKQRMLSAQKQALDVQMERYRQAFRLGVRDAVSTLESAIQGWETSQHTLEQATEGLRMSRLGYQEGVVTHADLLSSRTAYLGAELNEFSRRLAVLTAYQDLLTKLGITEPSAYLPATEAALPRSLMQEKEAQDEQNH